MHNTSSFSGDRPGLPSAEQVVVGRTVPYPEVTPTYPALPAETSWAVAAASIGPAYPDSRPQTAPAGEEEYVDPELPADRPLPRAAADKDLDIVKEAEATIDADTTPDREPTNGVSRPSTEMVAVRGKGEEAQVADWHSERAFEHRAPGDGPDPDNNTNLGEVSDPGLPERREASEPTREMAAREPAEPRTSWWGGESPMPKAEVKALYAAGLQEMRADIPDVDENHDALLATGQNFLDRHPFSCDRLVREESGRLLFTGLMSTLQPMDEAAPSIGDDFVHAYVRYLQDNIGSPNQWNAWQDWVQADLSEQLPRWFDSGLADAELSAEVNGQLQHDPSLQRAREFLDSRGLEEYPYNVVVISDSANPDELARIFGDITGCSARGNCIFIRERVARGLLRMSGPEGYYDSAHGLTHEFGHVEFRDLQRPYMIHRGPGGLLKERVSDVVAAHAIYPVSDRIWRYPDVKAFSDTLHAFGVGQPLLERLFSRNMPLALRYMAQTIGLNPMARVMCYVPGAVTEQELRINERVGRLDQIAQDAWHNITRRR